MCVIPQNERHCLYQTNMAMNILASALLSLMCKLGVGDTFRGLGLSGEHTCDEYEQVEWERNNPLGDIDGHTKKLHNHHHCL